MYKFEPFYRAKVDRVVDGDTLVLSFYLGLGIWLNEQKVRLVGINAPEVTGVEKEQGLKVTAYLKSLLDKSDDIIVRTDEKKKGKYGRFLVVVFGKMGGKWINFNERLVQAGAAREYMASTVEEIFNPDPADIESRIDLDELKTETEVYDREEAVQAMLNMAKEILHETSRRCDNL
jgi:endonuclease YncB( thermonuclease family)